MREGGDAPQTEKFDRTGQTKRSEREGKLREKLAR
jgi:hypothetical protein